MIARCQRRLFFMVWPAYQLTYHLERQNIAQKNSPIMTQLIINKQFILRSKPDLSSFKTLLQDVKLLSVVRNPVGKRRLASARDLFSAEKRMTPSLSAICILITCICKVLSKSASEITVPLKFGSKELTLTFPPSIPDAKHMAKQFCQEKGMADGEQYDSCFDSVSAYLIDAVNKHRVSRKKKKISKRTPETATTMISTSTDKALPLKVTLEIGGTVYNIDYNHSAESASEAAMRFCGSNKSVFGLTTTTLHNCVDPVRGQLDAALTKHKGLDHAPTEGSVDKEDPKVGVESRRRSSAEKLPQSMSAAAAAAKRVAKRNAGANQVKTSPVKGLSDSAPNKLMVTLSVGGASHELSINRETQTVEDVATAFCREKMQAFGLTEDNMREYCVVPVGTHVQQAVDRSAVADAAKTREDL